jgi:hypothetical protein
MAKTHANQINPDRIARIVARAKAGGSSATTLKNACKYILSYPQGKIAVWKWNQPSEAERKEEIRHIARKNAMQHKALDIAKPGDDVQIPSDGSYRAEAVVDWDLGVLATAAAKKRHPRKKHLYQGAAYQRGPAQEDRVKKIHYKGRFQGRSGSSIYVDYQSAVAITRSGNSAVLVQLAKLVRRIIAPTGMQWQKDDSGVLLRRLKDGMDYHPTIADLKSKNFATRVRKAMTTNRALRIASRKIEQEQLRQKKLIEREIGNTPVGMEDAQRAGFCVNGTVAFCAQRLGLTKEEIIAGGHLFAVPARRLLALGDERAKKAVRCAWERETLVSI